MQSGFMSRAKLQLLVPAPSRRSPVKLAWRASVQQSTGRKQVAAVCYRLQDGELEFLLVRTRKGRWIFPKGGVEPGLTFAESAALEAFEEAGAHGRIEEAPFTSYTLKKIQKAGSELMPVRAYLCEVTRLEAAQEFYRDPTWHSQTKAKQRLREGRSQEDAAEFSRVVDAAASRVKRLRGRAGLRDDRLQRVYFEPADSAGSIDAQALLRYFGKPCGRSEELRIPIKTARPKLLQLGRGRPEQ
jgi:8-oxo-dGTP pyrophosphatase MutT (NUDIX family)